jgi:hypothetical protein
MSGGWSHQYSADTAKGKDTAINRIAQMTSATFILQPHRNKHPPHSEGSPMPPHRRTKFTVEQLADALRIAGGVHAEACRVLLRTYGYNVNVTTMGRLVASSPHLQAVKKRVEQIRLDYVESALWRRIESGDVKAQELYLRLKGSSRGYITNVKHSGYTGAPIQTVATFDFKGTDVATLRKLQTILRSAHERAVQSAAKEESEFGPVV